ncbi:hypothetical protein BOTBODRAFT_33187 [Botryobasidium botryosum FD-172 SS1]|uniref:UDENN domain-containing protein n=1 Tax=Botryobasidium botryosum (strain FD-172 SS1) TaxID=930990 RepID=A0A067MH72_BOTB1|nr:hypothetical protein BOTBODRAFT_33187 [Botryobasidium botryosum FD-172 SS1]
MADASESHAQHVSFILLAEFDIDQGSVLARQYPFPTGTDEQVLAEFMLPDGAHSQTEDWTIFFLNQTPMNTIAPVFAPELPERSDDKSAVPSEESKPELLYVLNLVRTKKDQAVRRGGIVKAMAICTHHPFIQIFKPILLVALEDYFSDPSMECLARLFDAVNAMDLSAIPHLSRSEKLVLRSSERRDTFIEKFAQGRRSSHDVGEHGGADDALSEGSTAGQVRPVTPTSMSSDMDSALGGSVVWIGEQDLHSDMEHAKETIQRTSFDRGSVASGQSAGPKDRLIAKGSTHSSSDSHQQPRNLDTHFFSTSIAYKGFVLPIKIPLYLFPGEVGDYSLIELVQTFSSPTAIVTGPLHSHLHTNGHLTHPIIVLFNALVTQKRVVFLGYGKPAGLVASFVLAACALGSGSGLLRGFTERAFPYCNLSNEHIFVSVPGFIVGVTNPIFESRSIWDVLCNIETGKIIVNKDIRPAPPLSSNPHTLLSRSGIVPTSVEDDASKIAASAPKDGKEGPKNEFVAKADSADNHFMEDILSAISFHYGETLVRSRFTDYVLKFLRVAARYEELAFGSTSIGYPSLSFIEGDTCQLGSGIVADDNLGPREMVSNMSRIEGWRATESYGFWKQDFQSYLKNSTIRGFDVHYQIWRLRNARSMPDAEVDLIWRSISANVRTYEQIVELLSWLPPHSGGLLPIGFGLFHQQEIIREITVDFLNTLRAHNVGAQFVASLNYFHRIAYIRMLQAREAASGYGFPDPHSASQSSLPSPGHLSPSTVIPRTAHPNMSTTSLGQA